MHGCRKWFWAFFHIALFVTFWLQVFQEAPRTPLKPIAGIHALWFQMPVYHDSTAIPNAQSERQLAILKSYTKWTNLTELSLKSHLIGVGYGELHKMQLLPILIRLLCNSSFHWSVDVCYLVNGVVAGAGAVAVVLFFLFLIWVDEMKKKQEKAQNQHDPN